MSVIGVNANMFTIKEEKKHGQENGKVCYIQMRKLSAIQKAFLITYVITRETAFSIRDISILELVWCPILNRRCLLTVAYDLETLQ